MTNVFYGRENINKDKFIYENISGNTLLLVPDQFTLQAERDAFFYLNKKGLLDIEILSLGRLADRIVGETGKTKPVLDKQGRHMILNKIFRKRKDDLIQYKGYENNTAFLEMVNNFISEIKTYNVEPENLESFVEELASCNMLNRKLREMLLIYKDYENYIDGIYIDPEDYISEVAKKVSESKLIKENTVWIYGFDYFTAKNLELIKAIMDRAKETNIVLTYEKDNGELFALGDHMMRKLKEIDDNIKFVSLQDYEKSVKRQAIYHVEKSLFSEPADSSDEVVGVTLVQAANYYNEAETAASYILALIREKGYRLRDIAVICNDLENRGKICKRVFAEYGINLFLDSKRDLLYSQPVKLIIALFNIITNGYRYEDVISYVKTGMITDEIELIEEFENYAHRYKIKGAKWKGEFVKGKDEYNSDLFEKIESLRNEIIQPIVKFDEKFTKRKKVIDKVKVTYDFLANEISLPQKIEKIIGEQIEENNISFAEENAQIWNIIIKILEQLGEVLGDENISKEEFRVILEAGLKSVEVGLLPPTCDGLMMGTIQRTRTGSVKAMVILGANEGVLPANISDEGILNEDEKIELESRGITLSKMESLRSMEERLAIYRNLCKCEDELFVSYSSSDESGGSILPSPIFLKLKEIFPNIKVLKDIQNREEPKDLIGGTRATLEHLVKALKETMETGELDGIWKCAYQWFKDKEEFQPIKNGFNFNQKLTPMERETVKKLYLKDSEADLILSPSRLEKFGRCPFSHLVNYGLRPEKKMDYEISLIDAGNIYHECMMEISKSLTEEGVEITSEDSKWMKVSDKELTEKVRNIVDGYRQNYREGLLQDSSSADFRSERIFEVCNQAVNMMVNHVRRGNVKDMMFEEPFGKGHKLPPIKIPDAENIFIEGKLDRLDILSSDRVKVIDYKSGADKYDEKEMLSGYKFQLLVYLKAAMEAYGKPAGAFYFHVKEQMIDGGKFTKKEIEDSIANEILKAYRMDGIMVDDDMVKRDMDFDEKNKSSIFVSSKKTTLPEKEFMELFDNVLSKVYSLSREIQNGEMAIRPKKIKEKKQCTYCDYKGICKFDLQFDGCEYEKIK
ncbi:MAG: PD-(D/E)XK nuclease family protein [Anaerovoracaceae bacterium]